MLAYRLLAQRSIRRLGGARPVGVARVHRLARYQAARPEGPTTSNNEEDLPEELRDVGINEDGLLIDTKTGKVINEMGATRFDVAVRALRGELDPPEWVENTERSPGLILSALYQFPRSYIFQVVGRADAVGSSGGGSAKDEFVSSVVATVSRVTQAEVEEGKVEVKDRLGGKYISVAVDVQTRAPELVGMVYEELGKDPRVIMRF